MKKLLLSTLAATALLSSAEAGSRTWSLGQYGSWTAYQAITNSGDNVCGAMVSNGRSSMHVKWYQGAPHLTLQASKTGWRIPEGTTVTLTVGFDRAEPWTSRGAIGKGESLQMSIGPENIKKFMEEFREADKMYVAFEGNEGSWTADMTGSRGVAVALGQCMARLGNPTQPFGDRPTQPYTSQPRQDPPSQPFTPARRPVVTGKDREA